MMQVVYKNGKGEPLFKDLPPASLGKLRPAAGPKPVAILSRGAPALQAAAAGNGGAAVEVAPASGDPQEQPKGKLSLEEGNDNDNDEGTGSGPTDRGSGSAGDDASGDDDDGGEIFVFRGVHSAPGSNVQTPPTVVENGNAPAVVATPVTPAAAPLPKEPVAPAEPTDRRLGGPVIEKDLMAVSFSPNNTFREGELVVVPRSAGGFTYGTVQGRCECACPIGPPAHKHSGWRGTSRVHCLLSLVSSMIACVHSPTDCLLCCVGTS
jgi:hypothetical protein